MLGRHGDASPCPPLTRRRLLGAALAAGATHTAGTRRRAAASPRHPFPRRLTYAAGTIRPDHRTQAEQDDDVRAAYDRWKASYLVAAGEDAGGQPRYRVAFGKPGSAKHAITVSEGQGYGMLLLPHVAGHDPEAQTIFDGLWAFARDNPSGNDDRLMNWHVPEEGTGLASAFDGDADVAYGLLLADAQWGSDGAVDYAAAAMRLLAAILARTIGPRSRLPLLGDWVDPDGERYNQQTSRTSDFMLSHFRAFARATVDPTWAAVVAACQDVIAVIQRDHSPETGLLPDFVQPVSAIDPTPRPADPDFLEGPQDDTYGYNAGRVPWRIGVDVLLAGDTRSRAQVATLSAWIERATGGDPARIAAGYRLDGRPRRNAAYFTTFFAAPFAVAAMCEPAQQRWLNALYEAIRDRAEDYYEDSVALLCLLALTGNWWEPTRSLLGHG